MEAAEKLIAQDGMQRVSIKDIVREAGQKNESALQYHFQNLPGLVDAIHQQRNTQIHQKRAELLAELESTGKALTLRDLCGLMVYPTFLLTRTDPQFRNYVAAFSHEIVLAKDSALILVSKTAGGGKSGARLGELLRRALSHLDEATYRARMDLAVRMSSAAMGNHLRQKKLLKGQAADFFVNNLADALEGLLNAPVSPDTQSARK
ncbi:MAG: helix-turn-helix domain-containing protein [Pseudomonadales bacterium]|nr:helix-turn-helix domain-containing protein [Pseudomonadales bacterium]|tara:strand:+ start:5695 stop:6312 length:618 start_codon:yes stop_codon:yes gene_type:complete